MFPLKQKYIVSTLRPVNGATGGKIGKIVGITVQFRIVEYVWCSLLIGKQWRLPIASVEGYTQEAPIVIYYHTVGKLHKKATFLESTPMGSSCYGIINGS